MRLWALLPDESLTDDRSYLMGYLKGVFDEIAVSWVDRRADTVAPPAAPPDLILNLVNARNSNLLKAIDAIAADFGVPVSPQSRGAWRTEDKRSYLEDFPDVSPPTVLARSLEEVAEAQVRFGGDVVVKDPFGYRGREVERLRTEDDLKIAARLMQDSLCNTGELLVQPYLSGFSNGDKRVIAQRTPEDGFEVIAYILRKPPDGGWKSNLRCGGHSVRTELTQEEHDLAIELAPRAGVDNVSFDLAKHDGRLYYIEHNQGYGGIIDFDLDRGVRCVEKVGDFLLHLARVKGRDLESARPATHCL